MGYLQLSYNNSFELEGDCPTASSCEFSFHSISQGFGLPVWVGNKDMIILAETLESDQLQFKDRDITINNAGVMAAWISQPSEQWQTGIFAYIYDGFDKDDNALQPGGNIIGGGGRFRHEPTFHSYWGLVRLDENNNTLIYPYIGFDWFIGKKVSVSALIPWPSVKYSPDTDTIYTLGASISGSEWELDNQGKVINNNLGIIDFGLSYEKRLRGLFWIEAGAGYSGFARASITSDSDLEFNSKLEPSPFIRFSLNLRPE